jgi:lipoprotein-releasing system permease protein
MRLPFKIAARFLKSSKWQTLLIALGIAVGVSVQIFIGSLIQGLQKDLVQKTIGNSSQITVSSTKDNKLIENWEKVVDKIKASDDRIVNITPVLNNSGFIKLNDRTEPILMRGFQLNKADEIYNINDRVYEGSMPKAKYEVIVGKELQEELNLNLGESVEVVTPSGTIKKVKIVGFYNLNVANINKTWIITDMSTAQEVFSIDNAITTVEMQVEDKEVFNADIVADNMRSYIKDNNLKIDNWKAQNEQLLSGLNGQSVSSIMIQVFVLVSVVLGIASVLAITVVQKSKQIGILKAMGIKDRTASLIFLFQGLMLGFLGAFFGVLLGLGLAFSFTKFAVNSDGTPVVQLYISWRFILLSGVIAVLASTVAALVPARRTSKLSPIEVIKNN